MTSTTKSEPLLVTVAQATEILSLSEREIKSLIYQGRLERRYIGTGRKYYRIVYASLVEYADSLPEAKVEKD